MLSELRILLLTLIACLFMVFTTVSQAKIENMTQRTAPVTVGETAPDFTLEDRSGQKFGLADSRGKNPVVLVFYRGYW